MYPSATSTGLPRRRRQAGTGTTMSARQPGGAFTADVTGPEHGENGFAVFRRAWDTQTGEALPLPSLDTGERGAFRIGVRAARAHDAVIADVRFAHFRGRTSGPGEGGDRVLVHLMRQGSWRFTGLGGGEADVTVPDGSFLARRNGPPTSFDVRPGSRATVLILPPLGAAGSLRRTARPGLEPVE